MMAILALLGRNRPFLLLIALASLAAGFWAWSAPLKADREALLGALGLVCTALGQQAPAKATGKDADACKARAAQLAAFERDTFHATAQAQAKALADTKAKAAQDLKTARDQQAKALRAADLMDKANAQISSDHLVSGNWFAALNQLGGLHVSPQASPSPDLAPDRSAKPAG